MSIIELNQTPAASRPEKLNKQLTRLQNLLEALRKKNIPEESAKVVNTAVHSLNHFHGPDAELTPQVKIAYRRIHDYVVKELGLVPKGHYMALWIGIGMALFGLPIGAAIGAALGNVAFSGIGVGIGLPIGIAIGTSKDNKAAAEGRQLDIPH